jgi:hypothetical protein
MLLVAVHFILVKNKRFALNIYSIFNSLLVYFVECLILSFLLNVNKIQYTTILQPY